MLWRNFLAVNKMHLHNIMSLDYTSFKNQVEMYGFANSRSDIIKNIIQAEENNHRTN